MTKKIIHENRIFTLYEELWTPTRNAGPRHFYHLSCGSWVNIVPLTCSNEVVMVRQYRYGCRKTTFEIPGGMVDPEDGDPRTAARREMLEETGYDTSAGIVQIGSVNPNPALFDNRVFTFLAAGVRKVAEPAPEPWEALSGVELVPLAEIPKLIGAGEVDHALVICAFYFLENHLRGIDGSS